MDHHGSYSHNWPQQQHQPRGRPCTPTCCVNVVDHPDQEVEGVKGAHVSWQISRGRVTSLGYQQPKCEHELELPSDKPMLWKMACL